MAITIHTGSSDTARVIVTDASSNTALTLNKPTNVVNGDLMIAKIGSNNTLNPSSITLSGWNIINSNFGVNGSTACHTAYYWKIWNTGDPTSWSATIGASILDDESFVFRVTGHDAANPIDVAAASQSSTQSTGPVCPSITTVTDGAVAIYGVSTKNGSVITAEDAGQPSGTTLIQNKRSRNASSGINSALAYELRTTAGATGTRTWTGYTSTSQYHSAYSFAIKQAPLSSVSDVNTNEVVRVGSTGNTFAYSGFSGNPTGITIGSKAGTSVSASAGSGTFSFPDYVDGQTYPLVGGSQTFTAIYLSEQASLSVTLSPKSGRSIATMASAISGDSTYLGYHYALSDGDTIDYATAEMTVASDGGVTASTTGTYQLWHRETSTGTMTLLNVTINELGVVSIGLTAQGLTASGLTASGLTASRL